VVLFLTWDSNYRNTKCLKPFVVMEHCALCISLNSLKQSYCIYVCEDLECDSDLDRVRKFEMLARSF